MSIKLKIQTAIKNHTSISDEYKDIITKCTDKSREKTLTVSSVMIKEDIMDVIFLDRFEGGYLSSQFSISESLSQWDRVKYTPSRFKAVMEHVVTEFGKNTVFLYMAGPNSLYIFNNGIDAILLIPIHDLAPILAEIYGKTPQHIINSPEENAKEVVGVSAVHKPKDTSLIDGAFHPVPFITTHSLMDFKLFGIVDLTTPILEVVPGGGKINLLCATTENREGNKKPARGCLTLTSDQVLPSLNNIYGKYRETMNLLLPNIGVSSTLLDYRIHNFTCHSGGYKGTYIYIKYTHDKDDKAVHELIALYPADLPDDVNKFVEGREASTTILF